MGKIEIVQGLQILIDQWNEERKVLETQLLKLHKRITQQKFGTSEVTRTVIMQIHKMEEIEQQCKVQYASLELREVLPQEYHKLQRLLDEKLQLYRSHEAYKKAIVTFLRLQTEDKELEDLLKRHKTELYRLDLEQMTQEECEAILSKYIDFMAALEEKDAVMQVTDIQKLTRVFENKLIAGAVLRKSLHWTEVRDEDWKGVAWKEIVQKESKKTAIVSEDTWESFKDSETIGKEIPQQAYSKPDVKELSVQELSCLTPREKSERETIAFLKVPNNTRDRDYFYPQNRERTTAEETLLEQPDKLQYESTVQEIANPATEEKQLSLESYRKMIADDKIYCATVYLKAAAKEDSGLAALYYKLAYAVNDPMEHCSYSSKRIFDLYFDDNEVTTQYYMVSALLRNYYMDHIAYDYDMQQLYSSAKNSPVISTHANLNKLLYELLEFKEKIHSGVDKYADYRVKDKVLWEAMVTKTCKNAESYYDAYIVGKSIERAAHKRFLETKRLIFAPEADLGSYLKAVAEDDRDALELVELYLKEQFIKDGTSVDVVNIEGEKIDRLLDEHWEKAAQHLNISRKSSDLMSSLRMNLYQQVSKMVKTMCEWVSLLKNSMVDETDLGFTEYKKVRSSLLSQIEGAVRNIEEELAAITKKSSEEYAGRKVLLYTLKELRGRIAGNDWMVGGKFFYLPFLKNNKILLNTDYLPDMDTEIEGLKDFSLINRVLMHSEEPEQELEVRLHQIFEGEDDYGSAERIIQYFKEAQGKDWTEQYNIEEAVLYARKQAEIRRDDFIEGLELAQSYGRIENTSQDQKERILQIVTLWFERVNTTKNFGYFFQILEAFQEKIKIDAKGREAAIRQELEGYLCENQHKLDEEPVQKRIAQIQEMIAIQNYTVAEDLMNRLVNDEVESQIELLKTDYLESFIKDYDYNYKNVVDVGRMLRTLITTTDRAKKDTKGGKRLVDCWLTNGGHLGKEKLQGLLETLGFPVESVKEQPKISGKIENYNVILKKPENGRKSNYKHPIAAFGSKATEEGFRVVCLYGTYDANRLVDMFKEIGNAKHTIVLLDYALSEGDRKRLAKRGKAEASDKIFGVIDRVLLMYLINHYAETAINRMLMAVMMPYAYYQPYVVESANVMPPEIFIGRKEELQKIEAASGVNIVYGGRQLGKSALLRMAKGDIDQNENGDRAVLVDIKGLTYRQAALKVSNTLTDEGIFQERFSTDDWEELSRALKKRLMNMESKIPYLLLLMDEADTFIESCEEVNYQPFDALKDVQGIGTDRFKFVVAGLRNIVRFKRDIALSNNSVLTHLESITVKPFQVMEARELLEIPLFYLGLRFPKEKDSLVSMILATTNYFPGLIQLYCTKLLEAMKKGDYAGYKETETPPYEVQEKHIKKVLAEKGFRQQIVEKFMITLKVDEDDYYYIIALLLSYLYYTDNNSNGYSAKEILDQAELFYVEKLQVLSADKVEALMEEMKELNILRTISDKKYLFTRYSFFQMMGTLQHVEDEIMNYMENGQSDILL